MSNLTEAVSNGLTIEALVATVGYSVLGIIILILSVLLVNWMFRLNLHRELVKEHNVAFGIVIAGLAVAIAIIISGTISA